MMEKRIKIWHYLFLCCIFMGLLAYFCVAHPLILSDADDWYYASHWRRPLPVWGEFNGVKVFPETFMTFCSMLAVNFVMPIRHDYLMSLALVYGLVAALFVMAYVVCASKLIAKTAGISVLKADLLSLCFLLFHFLLYKNEWTGNKHLLWATDVTCLFHYTFPVLLCACLVMYFLKSEVLENRDISLEVWNSEIGYLKSGGLLLLVYLAVFSNMFSNIVLVGFSGIHLLADLISRWDKADNVPNQIRSWLKRKWLFAAIVVMWLVAVVFQTHDPRNDVARAQGASGSMMGAISAYVSDFTTVNKMAVAIMAVMLLMFLVVLIKNRSEAKTLFCDILKISIEIGLSFIATSVYLLILCGVASPEYLLRTDVEIGFFFFVILEGCLLAGVAFSISDNGRLSIVLPIITFILASQSLNYCKSYRDFNMNELSYEQELRISNDLIYQFVEADNVGAVELELHVVTNQMSEDNWPYPSYAGDLVGDALFRHGVISSPIKAVTVFDPDKNRELRVYFDR